VDFVDDVDFEFYIARQILDFVADFPDFIDAIVAGGVDFNDIADRPVLDAETVGTRVARVLGGSGPLNR
jgi:hypothetical protein